MAEVTFPARMLHVRSIISKWSRLRDVYVESEKGSVAVFATDGKALIVSERKQSGPEVKACIPDKIASMVVKMAIIPEVKLVVEEKICRLHFKALQIGPMTLEWERDVSTHPPFRDVILKGEEEPVPFIGFKNEILSKTLATLKKLCDEDSLRFSFFGKNKAVLIRGRGGPFDPTAVVMPFAID